MSYPNAVDSFMERRVWVFAPNEGGEDKDENVGNRVCQQDAENTGVLREKSSDCRIYSPFFYENG